MKVEKKPYLISNDLNKITKKKKKNEDNTKFNGFLIISKQLF